MVKVQVEDIRDECRIRDTAWLGESTRCHCASVVMFRLGLKSSTVTMVDVSHWVCCNREVLC